jgi:chemotaxis methyl-accepting protein methylase
MHFDHFIRAACAGRDLEWRKYRRASRKRVLNRIRALGLKGYEDYLHYLDSHPEEAAQLPNLLRVTVSRFFRDLKCWQELIEEVLPGLVARSRSRRLKALSIGACGGEEPYALALAWVESIQPAFPDRAIDITALELDQASLSRAGEALYHPSTLREVPEEVKARWFHPEKGGYRLHPLIRDMVEFRRLDLLRNPLPGNQDLILCRYLAFTYFRAELELAVSQKLSRALKHRGVLMIGAKEGPGPMTEDVFQVRAGSGCFAVKK